MELRASLLTFLPMPRAQVLRRKALQWRRKLMGSCMPGSCQRVHPAHPWNRLQIFLMRTGTWS
ncbi:RIKEN cDNA 2410022L05, isoform CRA_b [Mus musculus]|nr:RIKEN cDNA 2410022L05, isoform CRA_b [Mus musculus]